MFSSLAAVLRRFRIVFLGAAALALGLVLYTALDTTANPAVAADIAALEALREGDMRKLQFHAEPRAVSQAALLDVDDGALALAHWHGQWVVLNFWATWCAPCREEMPSLDRLQQELGPQGLAVLPVATGRNPVPAITRFYAETELEQLPILRDPNQTLSRDMAVLGLPVTVIVDPQGREVARMTGDAHWDSDSAVAILTALMEAQ